MVDAGLKPVFFKPMQAESAIAALNCSGVVLGSLPIRLVFLSLGPSSFDIIFAMFLYVNFCTHSFLNCIYAG